MPILTEEARSIPLPRMYRVRQRLRRSAGCGSPPPRWPASSRSPRSASLVAPGARVAVAVGSRGIRGIDRLARSLIDGLKALGASPFIVPAMGSHGGASAEGQRDLLARYGVSEDALGVPVMASMATTVIAETAGGVPIHFSSEALAADLVVPLGARQAAHRLPRAAWRAACARCSRSGSRSTRDARGCTAKGSPSSASCSPRWQPASSSARKWASGIAIVENAHDETAHVEAVPAADFLRRDAELLVLAKRLMARIMLPAIDVLVVERIGKDISGAGMDPNIMGRTVKGPLEGYDGPEIKRIVVLGLTEATHGNAIGIGAADYTLEALVDEIDREATYANSIAAGYPESGRIPIALADEAEAIRASLGFTPGVDLARPRVVRIRNTLELRTIEVSEALLDDVRREPRLALEE